MASLPREPRWLSRVVVDAIHHDQLREHGGLPGVRDENVLESALARAKQKWHHDPDVDLPALAAAYTYGLVKKHSYRDGKKRLGFLAMATFLDINGYEFEATDIEVVTAILSLASGASSETTFTDWIRSHSRFLP
jgi:death-on-curing protein